MFKRVTINALELLFVASSAFSGAKFIERRFKQEEIDQLQRVHNRERRKLEDKHQQEIAAKQEALQELERRLSLFEMDENDRLKEFKHREIEKLHLTAQYVLQKHLEASTKKLNSYMDSLSCRLIAAEIIMTELMNDLDNLKAVKQEQQELEELAAKVVADDVDALGRNYCSMDALNREFTTLIPLLRQYSIQNSSSNFSLFKYLMSYWLSRAMFTDSPTCRNDPIYAIQRSLASGQLVQALIIYQRLQGWPRLILRDWADRCYTRLEYIQEIQGRLYMNKL